MAQPVLHWVRGWRNEDEGDLEGYGKKQNTRKIQTDSSGPEASRYLVLLVAVESRVEKRPQGGARRRPPHHCPVANFQRLSLNKFLL